MTRSSMHSAPISLIDPVAQFTVLLAGDTAAYIADAVTQLMAARWFNERATTKQLATHPPIKGLCHSKKVSNRLTYGVSARYSHFIAIAIY